MESGAPTCPGVAQKYGIEAFILERGILTGTNINLSFDVEDFLLHLLQPRHIHDRVDRRISGTFHVFLP